jgi:hypothetical protein
MEVDTVMQDVQKRTAVANTPMEYDSAFDMDKLHLYYKLMFPYKKMFKWLSYCKAPTKSSLSTMRMGGDEIDSDYFYHREFSFTLQNDIYCRYLCFKDAIQFHQTLYEKMPIKIDIGAVYNIPVSIVHLINFSQRTIPPLTRKCSSHKKKKWC